jgi:hypothetical protein
VKAERSGRFRARYRPNPGAPYVNAPHTFATRKDAERWLERVRVDLERGEHRDTRLGTATVSEFGERFLAGPRHAAGTDHRGRERHLVDQARGARCSPPAARRDADREIVRSHLTRLGVTRVDSIPSGQYLTCKNAAGQIVMQVERGHLLFPARFAPPNAVPSDRNRRFAAYVPLSSHRPRV